MTPAAFQRYAAMAVPRYTSYPTAAEFSPAVGEAQHTAWLRALPGGQAVSAYIHVPYCRQLCHYCGCSAKVARRPEIIDAMRRSLQAEIGMVAGMAPGRLALSRLAWGGGTPSILGADGLAEIVATLHTAFDFIDGAEHSIELDPRAIEPGLPARLAQLGVDRVSLGVQDIDPAVQAAIGRIQPLETLRNAVDALRDAGIGAINMDLIYGLPLQTEDSLAATCRAVADLAPQRIACYGYAHLPERRANQRLIDVVSLPDPRQRLKLAQAVATTLGDLGYLPIGIDHFARPGDRLALAARDNGLHRNFQGYTDDDSPVLLGFGPSSISRLPGGYVQAEPETGAYGRCIADGRLPTRRGHALTADDRARAGIIEQLMCNFGVDLGSMAGAYADELALLRPMAADGVVAIAGSTIVITPQGRLFTRLVAAVFDRFRTEGAARFSNAV